MRSKADIVIATAVVLTIIYLAEAPLAVLFVSAILAFMLDPLVAGIEKLRLGRSLSALFAVLVLLTCLYGIFYLSYSQAVSFFQDLPKYSGEIRNSIAHMREKVQTIQKSTEQATGTGSQNTVKVQSVSNWTEAFGSVAQASEVLLYASFVPFLTFFMLTWKEHVWAASVRLFKEPNRSAAHDTLGQISTMMRRFIVGNVLVGLFIGTVSLIVFGIIRLPHFYFVGYISGFLSLVPYLGVPLAIIPPLLSGLTNIHSTQVITIIVTVLGLHLFSMNVLYPKFLGRSLEINPLAATTGLLFWGWMWGALGLILAIPIMAALKIIFDHVSPLKPYGVWLGDREVRPPRVLQK
jgi:predicted PurR-regulated permease PerM